MISFVGILFILGCLGIWYFTKKDKNKKYRNYSIILTVICVFLIGINGEIQHNAQERQDELTIRVAEKNDYGSNEAQFNTNSAGTVLIKGKTLPNAKVTLIPDSDAKEAGLKKQKTTADKNGNFKFSVDLTKKQGLESFTLEADSKGLDKERLDVSVFNDSKAYHDAQAAIEKQEAEKKKIEEQKAKEEAEKKKIEEQKAKEEAEKKQQEAKLKADQEAKKQEEIKQKTSAAQTILAQAEANPTRDNYHAAASAIQSIPGGNQELSNRLANVDSTIKSNEAAEAERQKQQAAEAQEQQAAEAQQPTEQQNSYTVDGQWSVAANGMVFARSDSRKYYSRVTNPANYQYMTQIDADNAGYVRAPRGNQYARP